MASFEKSIERAVADKVIPGCVLHALNRDCTFQYTRSFGSSPVSNGNPKPLDPDDIMWIASCTKLMTSICAMQLVERGLTTLDEPVYKHIPELKARLLISGFNDDGSPITTIHKEPITLRRLLTHTSGLSYEESHPSLAKYNAFHKPSGLRPVTLLDKFCKPLVFEPGHGWSYGPSIDFAGLLIERITKVSLEVYMQDNLWTPLGIRDMTFSLSSRPDLRARLIGMTQRNDDGSISPASDAQRWWTDESGTEVTDCLGGQGVFASPAEYIKILHAILTSDENEKILKKETVQQFFTLQLTAPGQEMLNLTLDSEFARNAMGGPPKSMVKDWGLGGLVYGGDGTVDETGRKWNRIMVWGGLPNLIWMIDRDEGLTALYSGQLIPTGDTQSAELIREFQKGMYELNLKQKSQVLV